MREPLRGRLMLPEDWLRVTSRSVAAARMIDASVPNMARVWNYLAGGRDNFEADRTAARRLRAAARPGLFLRDRSEVARWLDGFELVEPGIVEVHQWRPARGDRDYPFGLPLLGALARKPR